MMYSSLAVDIPISAALCFLYGDPGSGMFLWQIATAAAIGLLFYAKTIVRRLRLIRSKDKSDEDITAVSK